MVWQWPHYYVCIGFVLWIVFVVFEFLRMRRAGDWFDPGVAPLFLCMSLFGWICFWIVLFPIWFCWTVWLRKATKKNGFSNRASP